MLYTWNALPSNSAYSVLVLIEAKLVDGSRSSCPLSWATENARKKNVRLINHRCFLHFEGNASNRERAIAKIVLFEFIARSKT